MTLADALVMLAPWLLVYGRIQAFLLALPAFGERILPIRVRVGLGLGLTPLFAWALAPVSVAAPTELAALVGAELIVGIVMGLMVRILAMSLDIAATALAQSASLSAMLGLSEDMPPHPIGNLMHLAGLAVLMAMGLPVLACQLLADSFLLKPAGTAPQIEAIWPVLNRLVIDSFALALLIASPFILGGFLFQLLSGVVARVMPAMPVVFIAAPAAILLALFALALLTPGLLGIWGEHVARFRLPEAL